MANLRFPISNLNSFFGNSIWRYIFATKITFLIDCLARFQRFLILNSYFYAEKILFLISLLVAKLVLEFKFEMFV